MRSFTSMSRAAFVTAATPFWHWPATLPPCNATAPRRYPTFVVPGVMFGFVSFAALCNVLV